MNKFLLILAVGVLLFFESGLQAAQSGGKPLKIFLLAGQSNMQGQARVRTIERLPLSDESKQMYIDMEVKDGLPSPVKNTYGVYFTGGDMKKGTARDLVVNKGPFAPGYGGELTADTTFGPDYTFGIYMQKHIQGPMLIIKTAWGGRDLLQQFRPPSAGPFGDSDKDRHGNPIGHYYQTMVKQVKEVLADPSQYYPDYDKNAGYELAGFVWFQGFNDVINGYYKENKVEGKILYSQYTDLMAALIRDLRKDLNAPTMPVVIGTLGVGGPKDENSPDGQFRQAQIAPAEMPEFKGTVAGVRTEQFWDMEWERINKKVSEEVEKKLKESDPKLGGKALAKAVQGKIKTMAPEVLTPEELKILQTATSNAGYHYMGSAYIYGLIGKAFAEAMIGLEKK